MRPLATYIQYLLMTRHYAFVPGIGGFMLHEEDSLLKSAMTFDALIEDEQTGETTFGRIFAGKLLAPSHEIKFNGSMTHDDGMLANVIMEAEGLTFDEANAAIRAAATALVETARRDGSCPLGHLGDLVYKDGRLSLRAADCTADDPQYYGLAPVRVRSWQDVEEQRHPKAHKPEAEVKLQPAHRDGVVELPTRWLRRAAVILLIVTFFFANMIPFVRENDGSEYANIVSTDFLARHISAFSSATTGSPATADIVLAEDSGSPAAANITSGNILSNDFANITASNITSTEVLPNDSVSAQVEPTGSPAAADTISAAPAKHYLIVVRSCKSEAEALKAVHRLQQKGYDDLSIFAKGGRYRVFIRLFDVKAEAETYLTDLRADANFADAWLLAIRHQSLSLIIKNKDNDQLPVELSHANQPTERDQG